MMMSLPFRSYEPFEKRKKTMLHKDSNRDYRIKNSGLQPDLLNLWHAFSILSPISYQPNQIHWHSIKIGLENMLSKRVNRIELDDI